MPRYHRQLKMFCITRLLIYNSVSPILKPEEFVSTTVAIISLAKIKRCRASVYTLEEHLLTVL